MTDESRHQCLVYDGPPSRKLPILARILKQNMDAGYRCLYLNSPVMVAGMRSKLAAMGLHIQEEITRGRLVLSCDPICFDRPFTSQEALHMLESSLDKALNDGYKGLWATGDMSWEFGPMKDFSKLLEYEWGLEEIFSRRKELRGICQYHTDTLPRKVMRKGVLTHPSFLINETLYRINPHYIKENRRKETPISTREQDEIISALCRI